MSNAPGLPEFLLLLCVFESQAPITESIEKKLKRMKIFDSGRTLYDIATNDDSVAFKALEYSIDLNRGILSEYICRGCHDFFIPVRI